jgi:hypothetical protein
MLSSLSGRLYNRSNDYNKLAMQSLSYIDVLRLRELYRPELRAMHCSN